MDFRRTGLLLLNNFTSQVPIVCELFLNYKKRMLATMEMVYQMSHEKLLFNYRTAKNQTDDYTTFKAVKPVL